MDDVEHMTSKAIHVSQNSAPNIQYPVEHDSYAMDKSRKTIETNFKLMEHSCGSRGNEIDFPSTTIT